MLNFFTFKWGDLYDHRYPNRLYNSLKKHCTSDFTLTCITDNADKVNSEINIIDYNTFDPFNYSKDKIFTREKLVLLDRFQIGNNFWLDLDILIQDNIDDLVNRTFTKPTFIWNHWAWNKKENPLDVYGKGSTCYVNSSFVGWTGDVGQPLFDFLVDNEEKLFYTYRSLDKMLFYQAWRKDMIDFWEDGLFYNYNFSDPPYEHREGYVASLFNTSHTRGNALELHQAEGWAKDMWESYDA